VQWALPCTTSYIQCMLTCFAVACCLLTLLLQVGQDAAEATGGTMSTTELAGHTDTVVSLAFNAAGQQTHVPRHTAVLHLPSAVVFTPIPPDSTHNSHGWVCSSCTGNGEGAMVASNWVACRTGRAGCSHSPTPLATFPLRVWAVGRACMCGSAAEGCFDPVCVSVCISKYPLRACKHGPSRGTLSTAE